MARDLSYNGGAITAHYRKMKRYIAEDRAAEKVHTATLTKEQKASNKAWFVANGEYCMAVTDKEPREVIMALKAKRDSIQRY
jgi:hypothetical protein